jgi:hypothetical protein
MPAINFKYRMSVLGALGNADQEDFACRLLLVSPRLTHLLTVVS